MGPKNPRLKPYFFDFDSGGEFGLFGEAGAALHTTSTTTTTTTSVSASTHPLALPPGALLSTSESAGITSGSNSNQTTFSSIKKSGSASKSKSHWTDIEKDLFQKGLELFGANWNQLSSFISSKTPGQVRSYYKKWMEVASVVQEADTLGETLVFMPAENVCITTDLEDPLGLIETATTTVTTTPLSPRRIKSAHSKSKTLKIHVSGASCFMPSDEVTIPSVGEECVIEQCSSSVFKSLEADKRKERKSTSTQKKPPGKLKKKATSLHKSHSPFKVKSHKQKTKRKKVKVERKQKNTEINRTVTVESFPKVLSEPSMGPSMGYLGQVVHLVKDEMEESDVDIDVSDDEQLVIIDKAPTDVSLPPKVEEPKNVYGMDVKPKIKNVHPRITGLGLGGKKQHSFTFPRPMTERELDLDEITDEERIVHSEYFDGKGVKTPERYLRIRNYLINFWKQIKPKYVRKTAVRSGLKNCGDVNSISRLHEYLEKIGVINFECHESNYSSPLIVGNKQKEKVSIPIKPVAKVDRSDMTRQKKKLDMSLCEGGGLTISHDESGAIVDACHIPEASRSRANSGGKMSGSRMEQFKLVRCLEHDPDSPAPFSVIMHAHALITIDLHAHTSLAEVMGLLGGYYDPTSHTLHVTVAVPTEAVSSGVECDMCPVSQSAACTTIHEGGVQVVGWYHSHPTFPPNPSVQDMDTQSQMQQWFARQDAHFLGVIVSPFCPTNHSEASHIRCIVLDTPPHCQEESGSDKAPYKLFWSVSEVMPGAWEEVCQGVRKVVTGSRDDHMAVDWKGEWRGEITNWEKAIASLMHHLPHYLHTPLQSVRATFLAAVRECLEV
ncbi:Histone H2A deubiquitinase MYSM1 [Chionoecetes opilio]|uniref:Myb-like, SWIRM and MPN domain-containing protein 1 n=1 Tax=Chionoecetes opilio TaxID=41210 RepID=A0A8J5CWD8_CHIOP|nr:Histone H2A deubiquitinase MYSM1 [Chionoecetes opilio]